MQKASNKASIPAFAVLLSGLMLFELTILPSLEFLINVVNGSYEFRYSDSKFLTESLRTRFQPDFL